MILAYKQLVKQLVRSRVFVILLAALSILTPLSFFFVKFSIDGNITRLTEITGDTARYETALRSNTILAYNFLASMTALTAFVFCIFFYRFFRSGKKGIGCLKAMGFKDSELAGCFVVFAAVLSLLGGIVGLMVAYPMANILIRANMQTYGVSGLVRSLNPGSIALGLFGQTAVLSIAAYLSYGFLRGKEPGVLISGNGNIAAHSPALRAANAIADVLPVRNKFPLRIALRKPLVVLFILVAVMGFSTCVIIGRSLNLSSGIVFQSQTAGRGYAYDMRYASYQDFDTAGNGLRYLNIPGIIAFDDTVLDTTVLGLYGEGELFTLLDTDGSIVSLPALGRVVIGPGLADTYGLRIGDPVTIKANGTALDLRVEAVAFNAASNSVYVSPDDLTASGVYNGLYCNALPNNVSGAEVITREQRIEQLNRDAVSNQVSGVINQATGVLVGCILFFLALYLSFQDNIRDMLILSMMGYRVRAIRGMLVDVYRPLVWFCFVITLPPSIWMVKLIQRNLSIATGDYMPFDTNVFVIFIAFVALTLLYQLVQWTFGAAVRRVIRGEDIAEVTGAE